MCMASPQRTGTLAGPTAAAVKEDSDLSAGDLNERVVALDKDLIEFEQLASGTCALPRLASSFAQASGKRRSLGSDSIKIN
jgi:hypothetical protein